MTTSGSPTSEVTGAERPLDPSTIGRRTALDVVDRFGTAAPRTLARRAGVAVVEDDWPGLDGLLMLGSYSDETVTLYRVQIDAYASERGVDRVHLTEAVVAHELGHHFLTGACFPSLGDPSPTGLFARLRRMLFGAGTPKPRREAAANGFTFTLLEAHRPSSPVLSDRSLLTAFDGSTK